MKKFKLIASALLATTLGLTSCGGGDDPESGEKESEVSISIDCANKVEVGKTITVKVTVSGADNKKVSKSVDDSSVASLSGSGSSFKLKGLKKGSVVITFTSEADSSVSVSKTIEVYEPEWSSADKKVITDNLGVEVPYIASFSGLEFVEGEDGEPDSVYGTASTCDFDASAAKLESAGFVVEQYDSGFYLVLLASKLSSEAERLMIQIVDWSPLYEIFGSEDGEDPFEIYMYLEEGLTSWPEEAKKFPVYMDFEQESVPTVEADVYFCSESDYGYYVEVYNAKVSAEAYISSLEDAGWYIDDDVEYYGGIAAFSPKETGCIVVMGEGTGYYALSVEQCLPTLTEFPSKYLNAWLSKNETIFSIAALEGAEAYSYYETTYFDEDEEVSYPEADIGIYEVSGATAYAYLMGLYEYGFEVQMDDEGSSFYAYLGKIYMQGEVQEGKTESTVSIEVSVFIDDSEEESPLFAWSEDEVLPVEGTAEIETFVVSGFEGEITYKASEESKVSVDADGKVTAAAEAGEGSVEVKLTTAGGDVYTETIGFVVKAYASEIEVSGKDSIAMGKTGSFSVSPVGDTLLPEGDVVWSLENAEGIATIDENGVVTALEVEEDKTVTVKASVGGLEASKDVVIKYVAPATVETFSFSGNTKTSGIVTEAGVTINSAKGSGSSAPAVYDPQLRLYAGNTITFVAPEGHQITALEFTHSGEKSGNVASISASTGSYKSSTSTWTGAAETVTLTLGSSGQFRIDSVKITLDGEAGGGGEEDTELLESF